MKIFKSDKNNVMRYALAAMLFLIYFNLFGDGSAQLEQQGGPVKIFVNGGNSRFAGYRSDANEKINFYVTDPTSEAVYIGFGATYRGNSSTEIPAYFRITNAAGVVKYESTLISTAITSVAQAKAGPFGGYNPVIFNPTDTGVYSLEINEKIDGFSSQPILLNFLDITVANKNSKAIKPGRVWSKSWVLTTADATAQAFSKFVVSPSPGTLFEIDLNGMKGPFLNVFANTTGPEATGNFFSDVLSKKSVGYFANVRENRFKLYLTSPDYLSEAFPNIIFNGNVRLTGCSNIPFEFNFNSPSNCFAELVLDLNGVAGYQDNTVDRQWITALKTGRNAIGWDGKDGNKKDVDAGRSITVNLKPIYGYAHLPLFNVLSNPNGLIITNIKQGVPNHKVYWDDSLIYRSYREFNNNVEIRNYVGCTNSNCHRWSDLALDANGSTVPVGKDAVLNTWWYISGDGIETTLFLERLCIPIVVDDNFEVEQNGTLKDDKLFTNDFYNDPSSILSDLKGASQMGGEYSLDSNGFVYTPKTNFNGIDQFKYVVCNKQKPTLCDTGLVTIKVLPGPDKIPPREQLPKMEIHSGFSPNDDGINDYFEIKNIEKYTDNVVRIYSRWGDLVYEGKGYDNNNVKWVGTSSRAGLSGKLPAGTYYYVIDPGDGSEVQKSFVVLFR